MSPRNARTPILNVLVRKLNRCREEGLRNATQIGLFLLKSALKKRYMRQKYSNSGPALPAGKIPTETGRFLDLEEWAVTFKEHYPAAVNETIRIADLICRGDFQWLCPQCPPFPERVEWFCCFSNGLNWPNDFYQDLDYSSDRRPGDIRQTWELNRHQHFVVLGRAYLLTQDPRYADTFLAQLMDWLERNPPGYGINWLDAQEVALRSLSWTWAYFCFDGYPGFTVDMKRQFFAGLHAHADYILWHLSDRPVTHNHLVTEVCSLAILGLLFPGMRGARKWRDRGLKVFAREVLKQVWDDGLDAELSTNYHCFVLDSFIQLLVVMRANNLAVSEPVTGRIEMMVEAAMHMMRPDGSLPLIGDNDNGRAFRLSELNSNNRKGYLAVGAVLFERPDFKSVAGTFNDEAYWLLGPAGKAAFDTIAPKSPQAHDKYFLPGGMATSRTSWDESADHLILRGGPTQLRHGVSISHNHADLLSFELTLNGRPFLVDPGVYLYGDEDQWRYYYRKSLAHNTLVVDQRDQFVVTETRFGLPGLPLSQTFGFACNQDYLFFDMAHPGYADLGITHRRKILWHKQSHLLILDQLLGQGRHQAELYFHFAPEVALSQTETGLLANDNSDMFRCALSAVSWRPQSIRLIAGETAPIQGWVSQRYAAKQAAPVACFSVEATLPMTLATFLDMSPGVEKKVCGMEHDDGSYRLTVERDATTEELCFPSQGGVAINGKVVN